MTNLRRFQLLSAGCLVLSLTCVAAPNAARAGGQPKADFSIKAHVVLDESGTIWIGTWTINGVVNDAGIAAVRRGYHGLDTLWLEGAAGSMTIGLIKFDPMTEVRIDRFVVDEGTGAYESWAGASGDFHAHYGRTNAGINLKGFLP